MAIPGLAELIRPLAHYVLTRPIRVAGAGLLSPGSLIVWQAGRFYHYSVDAQHWDSNGHLARMERLVEVRLTARQRAALAPVTPPAAGDGAG